MHIHNCMLTVQLYIYKQTGLLYSIDGCTITQYKNSRVSFSTSRENVHVLSQTYTFFKMSPLNCIMKSYLYSLIQFVSN